MTLQDLPSTALGEEQEQVWVEEKPIPKERKRPIGVSVLAILNIIGSIFMMLAAFGAGGIFSEAEAAGAAGAFFGLLAVASLIVAIGLWRLRNWARITAIVLYALSAILGLVSIAHGDIGGLIQLIVAGNIAAYLCRSHVREAFSPEPR